MALTREMQPTTPETSGERRPRLAGGVELLGQFEGSAYREPQYLARRGDGQVVHLSGLLYLVASLLDGRRHHADIAEAVAAASGRPVDADNIAYLVNHKLQPLGLIRDPSDTCERPVAAAKPLLALRYRTKVIPPSFHRRVTLGLRPLFRLPVVISFLALLGAFNVWLGVGLRHQVSSAVRQVLFHPGLFLLVTVLIVFSGAFHELGHATAARYAGACPGAMGIGLYLIWPVFYTDLTDAYRLNRRGRLRTDLGGIYFNAILIVFAGGAYLATGFGPLLVFVATSELAVVYQFLPFIRMDGYYMVSDLIGVPNLFAFMGPVIASMVRWRDPAAKAPLLGTNRRARTVIRAWVLLTVGFLLFNFGSVAVLAPVLVPAEAKQARLQAHGAMTAFDHHAVISGINDLTDLAFFALAPIGMLFIATLLLRRTGRAIRRWWPTRRLAAAALAAITVCVIGWQGTALVSRTVTSLSPPATSTSRPTPTPARPALTTATDSPTTAATSDHTGAWTLASDGTITTTGTARAYGSPGSLRVAAPLVAIASTPDDHGYWVAGADGGVFAYGDAGFFGSLSGIHLKGPVVAIASTPDGRGYWLTAGDGGVFAFGDAVFRGSVADDHLAAPIVDIAVTRHGHGYWLAGADGGVFALGDAAYLGNALRVAPGAVTAITTTAAGYQIDHAAAGGPSPP